MEQTKKEAEESMAQFKVALVGGWGNAPVPEWVVRGFAEHGVEFVARECLTREDLAACASDADVVWVFGGCRALTPALADNLAVLPRCGALIRTGSGTDNVPVARATELGIIVANTPDAVTDPVADHVVGLLIAAARRIVAYDRAMRQGRWERREVGYTNPHIHGRTLGLVGFGRIPRRVVQRLRGFEPVVLAYDPYVPAETFAQHGARAVSLDELLAQADFVSVHTPLTSETHHLIGERELRRMKRTAILINTARGPVIDEPALVCALTEGWIAGAALDVFEREPIDPANPLLKLDNTILTPHIASSSDEYMDSCWHYSLETALDLAGGWLPRSYVNHAVEPRMSLRPK